MHNCTYLNGYMFAVMCGSAVDLSETSGSERLLLKLPEQLLWWAAEILHKQFLHLTDTYMCGR